MGVVSTEEDMEKKVIYRSGGSVVAACTRTRIIHNVAGHT
jgi:hypothetical protein